MSDVKTKLSEMDGVDAVMLTLAIIAAPFLLAWRGYSFVLLWTWFVVPVFAAPPIGIAQAVGLIMVLTFFKTIGKSIDDDNPLKDQASYFILKGICFPAFTIAFAWPVTWFLL